MENVCDINKSNSISNANSIKRLKQDIDKSFEESNVIGICKDESKERSLKRRRSSNIKRIDGNGNSNNKFIGKDDDNEINEIKASKRKQNNKADKIPLLPIPPPPYLIIPELLENQNSNSLSISRKRERDLENIECICNCKQHIKEKEEIENYKTKIKELENELIIVSKERKSFACAIEKLIGGRNQLEKYIQENNFEKSNIQDNKKNNILNSTLTNEINSIKHCIEILNQDISPAKDKPNKQ